MALSIAYIVMYFNGDSGLMATADAASRKAVELDPGIADGYTARIMVAGAKSQYDEAEAAFQKAVELDPSNFEAYYQYARYKFERGDREKAVQMFERARTINPYDFQTPLLMMTILRTEDKQKTLEVARDGVRAAEAHLEQHPDSSRAYILAAGALRLLAEEDKAVQFVESALRIDPESEDTHYNAACFYAVGGDTEKALEHLERGTQDLDWMENDTDLDSIRDHPRFLELLEKRRPANLDE